MTPRLRAARSTDAGKLGQMISQAVAAHDWKPLLHTGAQDIAHAGQLIDRGWVTVAVMGTTVSGFIAREGSLVHALFVADGAQGQGVGRMLLAHAMQAEPTLTLWTFQANTRARAFYAKAGFVETDQTPGDNDEGLPDVRLSWSRTPQPPRAPQPPQQNGQAPATPPKTKGHAP